MNADIDHPDVKDTQNLCYQAGIDEQHQCLWQRGLLPMDLVHIPPNHEPHTGAIPIIGNPNNLPANQLFVSGTYYGDGSGGVNSLYPRARRCGSAVIRMDEHQQLVCALKSNLPGDSQTVPRSEFFALLLLSQHANTNTNLVYYTDHHPLRNSYNRGRAYCKILSMLICMKRFLTFYLLKTSLWLYFGCPVISGRTPLKQFPQI